MTALAPATLCVDRPLRPGLQVAFVVCTRSVQIKKTAVDKVAEEKRRKLLALYNATHD